LTQKQFVAWRELFPYLVVASLALLVLNFTFNEAGRRSIP
jgi:hypothetical protein